jgi:hypothetical protein
MRCKRESASVAANKWTPSPRCDKEVPNVLCEEMAAPIAGPLVKLVANLFACFEQRMSGSNAVSLQKRTSVHASQSHQRSPCAQLRQRRVGMSRKAGASIFHEKLHVPGQIVDFCFDHFASSLRIVRLVGLILEAAQSHDGTWFWFDGSPQGRTKSGCHISVG